MSNNSANVTFEVRSGRSGTNRDEWPVVAAFSTGAEAARFKAENSPEPGCVFAVVKVTGEAEGDPKWREREQERFESGRYKLVPWEDPEHGCKPYSYAAIDYGVSQDHPRFRFLTSYSARYADHFAHIAESDATKVAYTESDAKGRKDIQKVLSVRDYLERFYAPEDRLRAYEMNAANIAHFVSLVVGDSASLIYATTADEMEEIYVECGGLRNPKPCSSCMGYSMGEGVYSSKIHPVRVYAAGDLQLAYMRETTDDGSLGAIIARGLVWPAKLKSGRIYGPASGAFKKALRALGYRDPGNFDGLTGARLLKVPHEHGGFVMPYIDGEDGHNVADQGDFFTIDPSGDIDASNTNGLIVGFECDHCNSYTYDEGDGTPVGDETWCASCRDSDASYCGHLDCYVEGGLTEARRYRYGNWYPINVSDEALADSYTEIDGIYYRTNDLTDCYECGTSFAREEGGSYLCLSCVEAHGDEEETADSEETEVAEAPTVSGSIDWRAPVELEDGSPCHVLAVTEGGCAVVDIGGIPVRYDGLMGGGAWQFDRDGQWSGHDGTGAYRRVRNVRTIAEVTPAFDALIAS